MININCQYNERGYVKGPYCTSLKIKRSFCGLGPRMCVLYPPGQATCCEHQKEYPRPTIAPPGVVRKVA